MSPSWLPEAEKLKTQVLDRLEQMSPQARPRSPGPDAWSAAQVAAHLVLVEELVVGDWRRDALQSPALKPSWRGSLVIRMVTIGFRSPARIPTTPVFEPGDPGDLPELSARWSAVRERFPDSFPADASSLWVIHPIFGPLSCAQMGTLLVSHLHYHLQRWPGKAGVSGAKEGA